MSLPTLIGHDGRPGDSRLHLPGLAAPLAPDARPVPAAAR